MPSTMYLFIHLDVEHLWDTLTVSSGTTAYLSDGDTQFFPVQGKQKNECKDLTVSITGFSHHTHVGEFSSEDDVGMQ